MRERKALLVIIGEKFFGDFFQHFLIGLDKFGHFHQFSQGGFFHAPIALKTHVRARPFLNPHQHVQLRGFGVIIHRINRDHAFKIAAPDIFLRQPVFRLFQAVLQQAFARLQFQRFEQGFLRQRRRPFERNLPDGCRAAFFRFDMQNHLVRFRLFFRPNRDVRLIIAVIFIKRDDVLFNAFEFGGRNQFADSDAERGGQRLPKHQAVAVDFDFRNRSELVGAEGEPDFAVNQFRRDRHLRKPIERVNLADAFANFGLRKRVAGANGQLSENVLL